ncbi:DUF445 domain-containing protein [Gracilibacillus halotolerans]
MVIIGAFIGGLTNSLAIKMLFRPYEPKFIGKFQIPFTPGLIPKRRDQLAQQMGKLVVQHLLTEESIRKKLQDDELKGIVKDKLISEWSKLKEEHRSVDEWLSDLGIKINKKDMQQFVTQKGLQQIDKVVVEWSTKTVDDSFGDFISHEEVHQLTSFLQTKILGIISSESTRFQLEKVVSNYVESKGFLGNMLFSMVNRQELSMKIQRLLIQYIQTEDGYQLLYKNVQKEWEQLKEQELGTLLRFFYKEEVRTKMKASLNQLLSVDKVLQLSVRTLLSPVNSNVTKEWIPLFTEKAFDMLVKQIPQILKQLNIEKMVEAQVATFPTKRMEEMVLSISRKEFKWITYLGALLGGWIGLLQGLLLYFTN